MSDYVLEICQPEEEDEGALAEVWTPRDMRADFILTEWGAWSRTTGGEGLGYPKNQPFAITARGREPVSDELALKVEHALRNTKPKAVVIIKQYYFDRDSNSIGLDALLSSIRDFINAFDAI